MITFCIEGRIVTRDVMPRRGTFIIVPFNIWDVILHNILLPLCSALGRLVDAYVVQHSYALLVAKLISGFFYHFIDKQSFKTNLSDILRNRRFSFYVISSKR